MKNFKVKVVPILNWKAALDKARNTANLKPLSEDHKVSKGFKSFMLLAEHSPIRMMEYDIQMENIPYWVAMHFVRHAIGAGTPYISTQREDRKEGVTDRDALTQGAEISYHQTRNVQSIINVSRKRLCSKASKKTRVAWKCALKEIGKIDPVLVSKCVPECVYRGFCPERDSCGRADNPRFQEELIKYRKL